MNLATSSLGKNRDLITNDAIKYLLKNKDSVTLFNIESTTRCNNLCTYCHIYNDKYARSYCKDINDELFDTYMNFISFFAQKSKTLVQRRFSGGDPIVLGDRLFNLANRGFKISGIAPYMLTAGKGITEEWIEKARESNLIHAFISVENPFDQDPGANPTKNVLETIKKFNHPDFPLTLGVCIVKNQYFGRLLEICDYFFNEVGQIPTLHELNYDSFQKPTEEDLKILKMQIELILNKYGDKLLLKLFPSVFPELCFGGKMVYLSDLPIQDSHNFKNKNLEEQLNFMCARFLGFSYPNIHCNTPCELQDFCNNVKWFWQYNSKGGIEPERKETYCKFKKIISDVYLNVFGA